MMLQNLLVLLLLLISGTIVLMQDVLLPTTVVSLCSTKNPKTKKVKMFGRKHAVWTEETYINVYMKGKS